MPTNKSRTRHERLMDEVDARLRRWIPFQIALAVAGGALVAAAIWLAEHALAKGLKLWP